MCADLLALVEKPKQKGLVLEMVCWGSVPSGVQSQCFASWQDQAPVVGTTGNNSLVAVDMFSYLLGQLMLPCHPAVSLPPYSRVWSLGLHCALAGEGLGMAAGVDNAVLGAAT